MFKYKTLRCSHCNSVIVNIPAAEANKLEGMNFTCECCGHHNVLKKSGFKKVKAEDTIISILNLESLAGI
ncbi:MAG: hypothetical protein Q8920_08520 [Bacillota bacterium]|nr:hypothetical protein [Bacillota bacterium]